jgi:hypothetical protein
MLDFIRPLGPVLDLHLTSLLLVIFAFSCYKNKYFTIISGLITMNIQAISVVFFLVLSGVNFRYRFDNFKSNVNLQRRRLSAFFAIISVAVLFYFVIHSVGYFDAEATYSLPAILADMWGLNWLSIIDPFCLFFGCSYNINTDININDALISNQKIMTDIGFLRLLYQFGLPWLIIVFIILRRQSRLGALVIFISTWHYPVAFGVLGFPILVHVVKSWGNPTKKCILPEKDFIYK